MKGCIIMEIAIVRDEIYGASTYHLLNKEFDCEDIRIESPQDRLIDEIEIDRDVQENLSRFELLILYIKHQDMALELVEKLKNKNIIILIGIWKGLGFKKQITKNNNIFILNELNDLKKIDKYDDYGKIITILEKVKVRVNCQGENFIEY